MDKDIFNLISRDELKLKLWQDLALAKAELLCKGSSDSLCKVRAVSLSPSSKLECEFHENEIEHEEAYLGYFFIGGEKYYFEANADVKNNTLYIPLPKELWHLQRRQNYRVKIPKNYPASYNILEVNKETQVLKGQLADLSSQGCRVIYELKNPLLKVGDSVSGELVVDGKPPISIQGIIRHIKLNEKNEYAQTFGIEFSPLSSVVENKLFAFTMEIHKKHFKSW